MYTILSLQKLCRDSNRNHFRFFAGNAWHANRASDLGTFSLRKTSFSQSALECRPFGGTANEANEGQIFLLPLALKTRRHEVQVFCMAEAHYHHTTLRHQIEHSCLHRIGVFTHNLRGYIIGENFISTVNPPNMKGQWRQNLNQSFAHMASAKKSQRLKSGCNLALQNIQTRFQVPQAALRLWGVDAAHASAAYCQPVSDEVKHLASSYDAPYVGLNTGLEAVQWLQAPTAAASVALMALRTRKDEPAFGLLVLASPDAQRFNSAMGTDFLEQLSALCGAALAALLSPEV